MHLCLVLIDNTDLSIIEICFGDCDDDYNKILYRDNYHVWVRMCNYDFDSFP